MELLSKTKLVFLDVETTGLSPAMGDRIIELGMIECQGATEIRRTSHLINPGREIRWAARRVHGISDADVAKCQRFPAIAAAVEATLTGAHIIGHNVRFDAGFIARELRQAGYPLMPLGCLDTCQLAAAVWDFSDNRLATVVKALGIPTSRLHRALDDASVTREVFDRVVREVGNWDTLTVEDLTRLHRYEPRWPSDSKSDLPKELYDALTNGCRVAIHYVNVDGHGTSRIIRPESSFASGRHTYVRAFCQEKKEMRTFRLDRIRLDSGSSGSLPREGFSEGLVTQRQRPA